VALRPAQVHAQEHLGPIAGVGAPGAGVDGNDGVGGVVLAAEHATQLGLGEIAPGDGELRLIVLSLVAESPRHGYEIIKALEERSGGFYSPSPGVIYPALNFSR